MSYGMFFAIIGLIMAVLLVVMRISLIDDERD